jgi:tetratricopeptide (TPR) repeat protein
MSFPVMILIIGFAYILIWGGLSLLRRERLSTQFAIEALILTLIFSGLAAWTGAQLHPVLFLLIIYLLTMRSRLLVDLANTFAQRGNFKRADMLYNFAQRLWPDPSSKLIILLNQGVSFLQRGEIEQAIAMLNGVLQKAQEGYLGIKYEAATHFNLGQAYRRKDMETQAVIEFNAAIDSWPASPYAHHAEKALEQGRHHTKEPTE